MTAFTGRIGIIGAGALGAFYGARLAKAGHNVSFLMRSDYDVVRQKGLFIKSFEGDFHIHPDVYSSPEDLGVCDFILVGLKTTANSSLPKLLRHVAGPQTIVLTLQNGLGNEDAITEALAHTGPDPASRVLGGISFICSNRTAPGHIHHIDHGQIRIGEFSAPITDRTHAIAELFRSADIQVDVSDHLLQVRWGKLVWNIPFNGLGVAARAHVAAVLRTPELRDLAQNLMDETMAAAKATGAPVDPSFPEKMMSNSETMGDYHSSMQLDFQNRRPLEVESIIGEPLRRALKAGLSVPHMKMLYALVKHADQQNRTDDK